MTAPALPRPGGDGSGDLAALADRYGLEPSSHRPPFLSYAASVWERRHFIVEFARAQTTKRYSAARLGQLWQVLTPLFNAAVYFVVFGLFLNTRRGVSPQQYVAFLTSGVMVFTFFNRSVQNGASAVRGNLGLIRALHFPRACMPLSTSIVEIQQMLVSMVVLIGIVIATGQPITVHWLMLLPTLVLATIFASGLTLIVSRIGANLPDISQLLPFFVRFWLYTSGVFYSIEAFAASKPALADVLYANPAAVYIELTRAALLTGPQFEVRPNAWLLAIGWALVSSLGGFLFFWRGEHSYGRG